MTKVLQGKMADAAEKLEFERAADLRDQLKFIETTVEKQKIISRTGHHVTCSTSIWTRGGYLFKSSSFAKHV